MLLKPLFTFSNTLLHNQTVTHIHKLLIWIFFGSSFLPKTLYKTPITNHILHIVLGYPNITCFQHRIFFCFVFGLSLSQQYWADLGWPPHVVISTSTWNKTASGNTVHQTNTADKVSHSSFLLWRLSDWLRITDENLCVCGATLTSQWANSNCINRFSSDSKEQWHFFNSVAWNVKR